MGKVDITKKEIAEAFKNLMEKKSFDTITVSEIMKLCGLNRLTFYYHFQDKYDLLDWIYQNEIVNVLRTDLNLVTWPDNLCNVLALVRDNRKYYRNVLLGGKAEFTDHVVETFREILGETIGEAAKESGFSGEEEKLMLNFFSYGITGIMLDWVKGDMEESPEKMVGYMKDLVENSKSLPTNGFLRRKIQQI